MPVPLPSNPPVRFPLVGGFLRQGVNSRINSWRTHDAAMAVQGDWMERFLNEHLAGVRLFGVVADAARGA